MGDGELRDALEQIAEIRRQMARTEVFRGFRAVPVACSGLLAWSAGAFQAVSLPEPTVQVGRYVTLWVGAAVLSAVIAGGFMVDRIRRGGSSWTRETTRLALEQFLPCVVAGGLLAMLALMQPELAWLLPGLWQLLFGLGIFATGFLLPTAVRGVAAWYVATGLICLSVGRAEASLAPWTMAVPFGVGQLMAAAVLYWTLEREGGPR
ncbi:MAG: hypothetical protein KatS3mg108_2156 [Isosphaeraceae bacterium]|jgi:hypothetical protein|nr:MAG: hypothetical protein KatS3mg108_2156 [Isosphaeraceae bacterium]